MPVVDALDVLTFAKWCDTEPTFYAKEDFAGGEADSEGRKPSRFPLDERINSKISLWYVCALCTCTRSPEVSPGHRSARCWALKSTGLKWAPHSYWSRCPAREQPCGHLAHQC